MSRKILLLLLAFLLAACTARPAGTPTPSVNQVDLDEQAVYAVVLAKLYGTTYYVINADSATGVTGVDATAQTLDYVLQNMHSVDPQTSASFRARNDQAYPLRANLDLGAKYVLLPADVKNQIFGQNQSGWEEFYNRFPDASGLTSLSRVGFNAAFDQALVYVGSQSGWLAGAGYYLLLKKSAGVWTIDQKVMTWIS